MLSKVRTRILKEASRFCDIRYLGNKEYKINKVYEVPKEKMKPKKLYNNFNVEYKDYNSIGVYKIQLNNKIYIGSTIDGFRSRFQGHNSGAMPHTKELLDNGAIFSILWKSYDNDKELVRKMEQEYINKYANDKNYELVNKKDERLAYKKHTSIIKLEVENTDVNKLFNVLNENNIKYKKIL